MKKVIINTVGKSRVPEFGGSIWARLQYLLGLERLGVESFWVDHLDFIDPLVERRSVEYLVRRFHQTTCDFGLADRYCIVYNDGAEYFGMGQHRFEMLAQEADLIITIGTFPLPPGTLRAIPRRAVVDVDPGFTQVWALTVD